MKSTFDTPRVALLCHHDDVVDLEGIAAWLASTAELVGLVVIHDDLRQKWRALRREQRRTGWAGAIDALAFRAFYAWRHAVRDGRRTRQMVRAIRKRYPADVTAVPRLDTKNPNSDQVQAFLRRSRPDLVLARCKRLLTHATFGIPRAGTIVLHPGICPEYRNAHGCFWALVNRDVARVGFTMLRVDAGVDTGPVFLQGSYAFDERQESHVTIQHRVVVDNLERIRAVMTDLVRGERTPMDVSGRRSRAWGQPRLSAYLKWKRALRRERYETSRLSSIS